MALQWQIILAALISFLRVAGYVKVIKGLQ